MVKRLCGTYQNGEFSSASRLPRTNWFTFGTAVCASGTLSFLVVRWVPLLKSRTSGKVWTEFNHRNTDRMQWACWTGVGCVWCRFLLPNSALRPTEPSGHTRIASTSPTIRELPSCGPNRSADHGLYEQPGIPKLLVLASQEDRMRPPPDPVKKSLEELAKYWICARNSYLCRPRHCDLQRKSTWGR